MHGNPANVVAHRGRGRAGTSESVEAEPFLQVDARRRQGASGVGAGLFGVVGVRFSAR
jgi:hypothetical protein